MNAKRPIKAPDPRQPQHKHRSLRQWFISLFRSPEDEVPDHQSPPASASPRENPPLSDGSEDVTGNNTSESQDPSQTLHELVQALRNQIDIPALEHIAAAFNLSSFETNVLLLCAGAELDPRVASFAMAHTRPPRPYVTFGLALDLLPEPHWSAVTPRAALRRWRLVELSGNDAPRNGALRIDERILHYLVGLKNSAYLDDRLDGLVGILPQQPDTPTDSQLAAAHRIDTLWSQRTTGEPWPVVQLCGEDVDGKSVVAAHACSRIGWHLLHLRASDNPQGPAERAALARLCERELVLARAALLVTHDTASTDDQTTRTLTPFIQDLSGPLLIATEEPLPLTRSTWVRIDIERPNEDERRALLAQAVGHAAEDEDLDHLVSQFRLDAQGIRAASAMVASETGDITYTALWEACRMQARRSLDALAQRIEAIATWDDIVLPEAQRATLEEIAAQVRQRRTVYQSWGFAGKYTRGLGISALFTGPSGTGKTMAAEVLANALQLDLYRIDLSQVVSKYIGETEKNLKRIFDAAEQAGCVLLFDEADALFGKRSEVKDSHDRYANIEVGYLLQRMETYRGLAILTTNMKSALDQAFLRRIRFICQFPFPNAELRRQIWQRVFPTETPTQYLDFQNLARLDIAGGNIRNIAVNAAFLAADAGEPVGMEHVLRAARSEYEKLEKPLPATALRGVA